MALSNLADWNEVKASPDKGTACGTAVRRAEAQENRRRNPQHAVLTASKH